MRVPQLTCSIRVQEVSQRQDPQRVVHSFSSSPYSLSAGFWLAGCPRGGNGITVYYRNTALLSIPTALGSKTLLSFGRLRHPAKTAGPSKKGRTGAKSNGSTLADLSIE